jgi:hypothetical protein
VCAAGTAIGLTPLPLETPINKLACSFGFRLPPHVLVPVHGVMLGAMLRLKPSAPFCSYMQWQGTRPLFHTIANK